jgi:hypothetical protein
MITRILSATVVLLAAVVAVEYPQGLRAQSLSLPT